MRYRMLGRTLQRDIEHEILPMAESLGLTVSAWGSLAGGVLSGKYSGGGGSGRGRSTPSSAYGLLSNCGTTSP